MLRYRLGVTFAAVLCATSSLAEQTKTASTCDGTQVKRSLEDAWQHYFTGTSRDAASKATLVARLEEVHKSCGRLPELLELEAQYLNSVDERKAAAALLADLRDDEISPGCELREPAARAVRRPQPDAALLMLRRAFDGQHPNLSRRAVEWIHDGLAQQLRAGDPGAGPDTRARGILRGARRSGLPGPRDRDRGPAALGRGCPRRRRPGAAAGERGEELEHRGSGGPRTSLSALDRRAAGTQSATRGGCRGDAGSRRSRAGTAVRPASFRAGRGTGLRTPSTRRVARSSRETILGRSRSCARPQTRPR